MSFLDGQALVAELELPLARLRYEDSHWFARSNLQRLNLTRNRDNVIVGYREMFRNYAKWSPENKQTLDAVRHHPQVSQCSLLINDRNWSSD